MDDLQTLGAQVRACQACRLARGRTHAVPGSGSPQAEILFIGEAPGFHEDQQGLPFVGAAGQFLDQLLQSISLTRQQVYIANVIKCRPPNNRDPQPDELEACRPYLDRQIALIKPKIIVTLGRISMQLAFPGASISQIHGNPLRIGDITYFPMFHPAAALHQPRYRTMIEQDMLRLPGLLAEIKAGQQPPAAEPSHPEQLSLF
ncbi:MAG: uracil-DNA glycosylase family protein [Anaerolineae bacterium]|jgi:uracil-DNA glycosylase family 4